MSVLYDAGVLVAAERNDRRTWADHRVRLELGFVPVTTAPVVAQVSRSPRQVQLRRLLRGCEVTSFRVDQSHDVGSLLARAGTTDVVDAHLVIIAAERELTIHTSDPGDIRKLANHLPTQVHVHKV